MAWKSTTAFYKEIVHIPMIVSRRGRIAAERPNAAASLVVPYWQIDPHRRTVKCRSFGSQNVRE